VDQRDQDSYQPTPRDAAAAPEALHAAAAAPGTDTELTPIFRALAERAADPVERFRRDPLAAPLPSFLSPAAPAPKMVLHAVTDQVAELPEPRAESRRHRAESSVRGAAHAAGVVRPVAQLGTGEPEVRSVPAERSGRHRVPRPVGRTHCTMPTAAHQPKHTT
jgi:hypothetical protein